MKTYEGRAPKDGGPGTIIVIDGDSNKTVLPAPQRHSPDGFQWGYGGSGPADTAYALLLDVTGLIPPPVMYQRFKFEVVANFDLEFTITENEIQKWVEEYESR